RDGHVTGVQTVLFRSIGSPTCTRFRFASAVIEKLPTAPEKVGGAPAGNAFTSNETGSLLTLISCCSISPPNGSAKKGSENGSSRSEERRVGIECRYRS